MGRADLVTVIAKDAIIADGFATALSNRIKRKKDVEAVFGYVKQEPSLYGMLVSFEGNIFLWGNVEMEP